MPERLIETSITLDAEHEHGDLGYNELLSLLDDGVDPKLVAVAALRGAIRQQTRMSLEPGLIIAVHARYQLSNQLQRQHGLFCDSASTGQTDTETL